VRRWTLAECSKRMLYTFTCPSCSSHTMLSTPRDTTTVYQMGHTIAVGQPMLRVQRRKLPDGSEPPRATRVRNDETQRVASSWRIQSLMKGTRHPQALYLSPDWQVSFTPLRVGWHRAIQVLPPGITWEIRLKPPGPDLTVMALAPVWSYGEPLDLAGSHPQMVTQAPLRS
jgi:hypothetical protein